jgi:hypothetical protein
LQVDNIQPANLQTCEQATNMRTIIIGLGNPILSDDGVGWKIAEGLSARDPGRFNGNRPKSSGDREPVPAKRTAQPC